MKINGIDGMTHEQLRNEIQRGGRFVVYQYCVSIVLLTFKQPSPIYFIKADEGTFGRGLIYSAVTMLFGWWGIPWGPIYSIGALYSNFSGGKDVTDGVAVALQASAT